jgi:hypothetical protein
MWRNIRILEQMQCPEDEIQPVKNAVAFTLTVIPSQRSLRCFWIKLHWTKRDQLLVPFYVVSGFLRNPLVFCPIAMHLARNTEGQRSAFPLPKALEDPDPHSVFLFFVFFFNSQMSFQRLVWPLEELSDSFPPAFLSPLLMCHWFLCFSLSTVLPLLWFLMSFGIFFSRKVHTVLEKSEWGHSG